MPKLYMQEGTNVAAVAACQANFCRRSGHCGAKSDHYIFNPHERDSPFDVGLSHLLDETVEVDVATPAEPFLCFRGVSEQLLDFRWAEILR